MYHTTNIIIKSSQKELVHYFQNNCMCAKNLYNTVLFRCRQIVSSQNKDISVLTDNEIDVLKEFDLLDKRYNNEKLYIPNYFTFDKVLKNTNNPDYRSELSIHSIQYTIKLALQDMRSYFKSLVSYKKSPDKFTGRPNLPRYVKSNQHGYKISNQESVIKTDNLGRQFLKLPKTKLTIQLGTIQGRLIEVNVQPFYDTYKVSVVTEIDSATCIMDKSRILGIDLGVNNFVTTNNNCGLTPFIINGKILKSYNQWYNKELAKLRSYVMNESDKKHSSRRITRLNKSHYNKTTDFYNKAVSYIINYCLQNNIGLIVIGKNDGWKQDICIGTKNNQTFCHIAHARFIEKLKLCAIKYDIEVIDTEESYTSKASLLDMDKLKNCDFSGKRIHRGLYKTLNGTILNADINGAGNIIRKYNNDAFRNMIDFSYMYTTVYKINIA